VFSPLWHAKHSFGYLCHIHGKAHVGLMLLYMTSLPRGSSRHVENLQDISFYFENEDSAFTSIINDSIGFENGGKTCFVHSRGPLS
jgi:hypothetical protein